MFNIKFANKILFFLSFILIIYISVRGFSIYKEQFSTVDINVPRRNTDISVEEIALPPAKKFDEYEQVISKRDIFKKPYERRASRIPKKIVDPDGLELSDVFKNYRLVGVLLDKDSKAIIEDLRNKKTLFLSIGDEMEGAVLAEIRENKAIFDKNGQRFELDADQNTRPNSGR